MMEVIFYSLLVYFTAWCQSDDKDSFRHATRKTSNLHCVLVNKRSESRYSAELETNQRSNSCIVTFNDSDISELLELVKKKTINIVDIHLEFQSNISNQQIKKSRWVWANKVGLEILSVLEIQRFLKIEDQGIFTTLNVGRTAANLVVSENPPGCILKKDPYVLTTGELLKRLSFSENELCYTTPINTWYNRCCKIKSFNNDEKEPQCYVRSARSQFVRTLETLYSALFFFFLFCGGNLVLYIGLYLPWKSECRNRWYYELNESPMSISSIFSLLFWDGCGHYKSTIRRMLLVILVGYLFSQVYQLRSFSNIFQFSSWVVCIFSELISSLFLFAGSNHKNPHGYKKYAILNYFFFGAHDIWYSATLHSQGAISLLTLPFNMKRWRESLQHLHDTTVNFLQSHSCVNIIIQKGIYCLLCLFYIPVTFVFRVLFIFISLFLSLILVIEPSCFNLRVHPVQGVDRVTSSLLFISSAIMLNKLLFYLPYLAIPFFSGIFLNIVYYFPYITFISVLSFYSWNFWKCIEEKYFILKVLIYEEIEDITNNNDNDDDNNVNSNNNENENDDNNDDNNNNENETDDDNNDNNNNENDDGNNNDDDNNENDDSDDNNDNCSNDNDDNDDNNVSDHNSENDDDNNHNNNINNNNNNYNNDARASIYVDDDEIVCVLSKKLYNKIRERLLPYDENLFYFALKLFFVVGFSYVALSLVKIFQASDVSLAVQMLSSFSVGALPHLMSIVASKKGEEEKYVWKKELRARVKQKVRKLTANNPEFRQILLIKQHPTVDSNKGTVHERNVPEEEDVLLNNEVDENSNHSNHNLLFETSV